MKQDCVGEIESSIMENLFMSYLDKNKVRLATMFSRAGVLPNADTRYVDKLVKNYYLEHDKGLLDKVDMIKNKEYNPDEPFQKQFEFRYLVGDVYAYLLMDTYKKNPEKAVEQYAKFLECNASLSLDDCSKVLFDDQTMTSSKVVEAFADSLDRKTQKIVEKQEERNMQ